MILSNTVKLKEIAELRAHHKEYVYLYFLTKDESLKITITKISDNIKYLESTLH